MMKIARRVAALSPQQLFLIDGLGALLSAFLLGVVMVRWEPVFGMPPKVLYPLAAIAGVFALYSLSCHFFLTQKGAFAAQRLASKQALRGIAVANLLYCGLTLGLVVYYYPQLTVLGVAYFLLESFVVLNLVVVEPKASKHALK